MLALSDTYETSEVGEKLSEDLAGGPKFLADPEDYPPGIAKHLEKHGSLPPGLQKKLEAGTPDGGLEEESWIPPGLARKDTLPPGLAKKDKIPPGWAKDTNEG